MLWPNGTAIPPAMSLPISEADFGPRTIGKGFHDGTDFAARFTAVCAVAAGRVTKITRWDGKPAASTATPHGNRVWVSHGDGVESSYSHLSQINVRLGDEVHAGDDLGILGKTGYVTGPHLHLEIRVNGRLVDPYAYLIERVVDALPAEGEESRPFIPIPTGDDDMRAVRLIGAPDSGIIIQAATPPYSLAESVFVALCLAYDLKPVDLPDWQYGTVVREQWTAFNRANPESTAQPVDIDLTDEDAERIAQRVRAGLQLTVTLAPKG